MNPTQTKNYDDLLAKAEMFDLVVDWESLKLVPRTQLTEKKPWLERWIVMREDKQWDHENQNNDGGE